MLKRIRDTKAEREARMNFTIENATSSGMPSMKVVDSPAAQQEQQEQ